jgi:IrrE N-terminal-like domain
MNTSTTTTAPVSGGALNALRALSPEHPLDLKRALQVTEEQAHLLGHLVDAPGKSLSRRLNDLIPTVTITRFTGLPVAATAFWGHHRWQIHVDAGLSPEQEMFRTLHELKHVIDHPRRTAHFDEFDEHNTEVIADFFASCVLIRTVDEVAR